MHIPRWYRNRRLIVSGFVAFMAIAALFRAAGLRRYQTRNDGIPQSRLVCQRTDGGWAKRDDPGYLGCFTAVTKQQGEGFTES
jgi:hypothetical protein